MSYRHRVRRHRSRREKVLVFFARVQYAVFCTRFCRAAALVNDNRMSTKCCWRSGRDHKSITVNAVMLYYTWLVRRRTRLQRSTVLPPRRFQHARFEHDELLCSVILITISFKTVSILFVVFFFFFSNTPLNRQNRFTFYYKPSD